MSGQINQTTDQAPVTPLLSHVMTLTFAQVARGASRLIFTLVVARVLGPKQFGLYALLLAVVEMLAVASGSGYADYLTREAAKDARAGWGLGGQLIRLRLTGSVVLAGATLSIFSVLTYPRTALLAAAWLSVSLIPRSVSETVQGVLRGVRRYTTYLIVELSFDCGLALGAGYMWMRHGGLGVVIATEIVSATVAAVSSLIFFFLFRTKERIRLSTKQLLEKSVIFNLYAFVGNLYDRLDVVLLSSLAGDYSTGIYAAAYRPMGTLQLLPYGVLYSLLPALSRNNQDSEAHDRFERAMGFLLSAAFAMILATMAFADLATHLLLGQSYAESALALKILIWAVILRYVNYGFGVQLLARGHERVFVVTSVVCLIANVVGNVLFIPIYSWRAAAVCTILTELVLSAQFLYWLRRTIGHIPKPFGWARTSLVFAFLVVAWLLGAHLGAPVASGAVSLLLFCAYVYRVGLFSEFATAWGLRKGSAVGIPTS